MLSIFDAPGFQVQPEHAVALVAHRFGGHLLFPNRRFDCRVEIRSQSTEGTNYVLARARRGGWSCGCRGWIFHHSRQPDYQCKHLKDMQAPLELALELAGLGQPPALPAPAGLWLHPGS